MTTMDDQIMAEAAKQREHEVRVAQINDSTQREVARQETARVESRHSLIGGVLIGVAVIVLILSIVGAITWSVRDDRTTRRQQNEQYQRISETCIREGNIWLDGNCIPAQKN